MKKISVITLAFVIGLLVSCNDDAYQSPFDTGNDFTDSNIRFINIDTFKVEMSTFKFDSLETSLGSRLLVGRYVDPVFGEVKSTAYVKLMPETYYIEEDAIFDSIVLYLKYDNYFYNDTLLQKTILIKELSKELRLKSDQSYFYNTTNTETFNTILGQKTFIPRQSNDSVSITLNNNFGLNLFTKFRSNLINDNDQFIDYLKGIAIEPDGNENASMIGFNTADLSLKIYYSFPDTPDAESEFLEIKYDNAESNTFYNKIEGNRSGTILQDLGLQKNDIQSGLLNNYSYIQSGIGITTKIKIPSIRTLAQVNDNNGIVFSSKLKIKLNNSNYSRKVYNSDSLYVYIVDKNNAIKYQLKDNNSNPIVAYIDKLDTEFNETYLMVPVEEFVEDVLNNPTYQDYGIILLPFEYNYATTRMILNGENNADYKSILKLTYAIYDN